MRVMMAKIPMFLLLALYPQAEISMPCAAPISNQQWVDQEWHSQRHQQQIHKGHYYRSADPDWIRNHRPDFCKPAQRC
jgi:hypothetical protein